MSPTYEKKRVELATNSSHINSSAPREPIFELDGSLTASERGNDECNLFDDAGWKEQRKLKHQRDLQRRGLSTKYDQRTGKPESLQKARQTRASHGSRDINRGSSGSAMAIGHGSGGRSIPGRRKEKEMLSPMQLLSKSVPSARSWPPDKGASDLNQEPAEENLNPNWSLGDSVSLVSSAPENSFLSRSFGSKREARTMTLFESAALFNEAGRLINHDDFHELGSSPEMGPQGRRKPKRRVVGRHRPEKKKSSDPAGDRLSLDDIVLELMQAMLPDIEVTKELNMLFLGGSRHNGEVFDFEDDAEDNNKASPSSSSSSNCKLLKVDMIKFQASLKTLLFAKDEPELELPLCGSSSNELIDQFFTDEWVNKCILRIIKMDVSAQYDAFAVVLALYRSVLSPREVILKTVVSACLAIFDHQALESLQIAKDARKLVSMKGIVAFLNAVLVDTERELTESLDGFGDPPPSVDESVTSTCDRIMESLKLLMRSSPGRAGVTTDDNNQVERFQVGSDSIEATTYSAIGEVINRLSVLSPMHGQELLDWMLRMWPRRNVQLQLFYVRFITGILMQFMISGVFLPNDLVAKTFSRLRECIKSPHFLIAKEAVSVCGNLPLMDMYLSQDQQLREQVAAVLHANATSHWNDRIRQMSDEYFDLLLDFA